MTKKASVYTKTGDKGLTGLVGGTRLNKGSNQIELYGEVDELNSFIGLVCSLLYESKLDVDLLNDLYQIQNQLFNLGSNLACEADLREKFSLPKVTSENIKALEVKIDKMDIELAKLTKFILPGGSIVSSHLHICRTVCRRLERKLCSSSNIPDFSIEYINRLSDYFFIASRFVNKELKIKEVTWN